MAKTGADPVDTRQEQRRQAVAEACISARQAEWKNTVHWAQWGSTLAAYAYPIIGDMPVSKTATDDVLAVLQPI